MIEVERSLVPQTEDNRGRERERSLVPQTEDNRGRERGELTASQCRGRRPGLVSPWIRGTYGLKFSMFTLMDSATCWTAGRGKNAERERQRDRERERGEREREGGERE